MSQANPLWGAPRIHGELLKLGIAAAVATVIATIVIKRIGEPAIKAGHRRMCEELKKSLSVAG